MRAIILTTFLCLIANLAVAQKDSVTLKIGVTIAPQGYVLFDSTVSKPAAMTPLFITANVSSGKNSVSVFYNISRNGLGVFYAHDFKYLSWYCVGQKNFSNTGYVGTGAFTSTINKNAVLFFEGGGVFTGKRVVPGIFFGAFIFVHKKVKVWHP